MDNFDFDKQMTGAKATDEVKDNGFDTELAFRGLREELLPTSWSMGHRLSFMTLSRDLSGEYSSRQTFSHFLRSRSIFVSVFLRSLGFVVIGNSFWILSHLVCVLCVILTAASVVRGEFQLISPISFEISLIFCFYLLCAWQFLWWCLVSPNIFSDLDLNLPD